MVAPRRNSAREQRAPEAPAAPATAPASSRRSNKRKNSAELTTVEKPARKRQLTDSDTPVVASHTTLRSLRETRANRASAERITRASEEPTTREMRAGRGRSEALPSQSHSRKAAEATATQEVAETLPTQETDSELTEPEDLEAKGEGVGALQAKAADETAVPLAKEPVVPRPTEIAAAQTQPSITENAPSTRKRPRRPTAPAPAPVETVPGSTPGTSWKIPPAEATAAAEQPAAYTREVRKRPVRHSVEKATPAEPAPTAPPASTVALNPRVSPFVPLSAQKPILADKPDETADVEAAGVEAPAPQLKRPAITRRLVAAHALTEVTHPPKEDEHRGNAPESGTTGSEGFAKPGEPNQVKIEATGKDGTEVKIEAVAGEVERAVKGGNVARGEIVSKDRTPAKAHPTTTANLPLANDENVVQPTEYASPSGYSPASKVALRGSSVTKLLKRVQMQQKMGETQKAETETVKRPAGLKSYVESNEEKEAKRKLAIEQERTALETKFAMWDANRIDTGEQQRFLTQFEKQFTSRYNTFANEYHMSFLDNRCAAGGERTSKIKSPFPPVTTPGLAFRYLNRHCRPADLVSLVQEDTKLLETEAIEAEAEKRRLEEAAKQLEEDTKRVKEGAERKELLSNTGTSYGSRPERWHIAGRSNPGGGRYNGAGTPRNPSNGPGNPFPGNPRHSFPNNQRNAPPWHRYPGNGAPEFPMQQGPPRNSYQAMQTTIPDTGYRRAPVQRSHQTFSQEHTQQQSFSQHQPFSKQQPYLQPSSYPQSQTYSQQPNSFQQGSSEMAHGRGGMYNSGPVGGARSIVNYSDTLPPEPSGAPPPPPP